MCNPRELSWIATNAHQPDSRRGKEEQEKACRQWLGQDPHKGACWLMAWCATALAVCLLS